jgi:hypothetical protein
MNGAPLLVVAKNLGTATRGWWRKARRTSKVFLGLPTLDVAPELNDCKAVEPNLACSIAAAGLVSEVEVGTVAVEATAAMVVMVVMAE